MKISRLDIDQCAEARGVAVVIDVIRAFTTAAIAFERGASKIVFVAESDEAFALKRANPEFLVMGEEGGLPPPGFDFGNSPAQLSRLDLEGVTLVQRTSNGTLGLVRCSHCDAIFAGSFLTARATVAAIRSAPTISIVCTGTRGDWRADEDEAYAEYLERLLLGEQPIAEPYLKRIDGSHNAKVFKDAARPEFDAEDVVMTQHLDRCAFAIEVRREGDLLVAERG